MADDKIEDDVRYEDIRYNAPGGEMISVIGEPFDIVYYVYWWDGGKNGKGRYHSGMGPHENSVKHFGVDSDGGYSEHYTVDEAMTEIALQRETNPNLTYAVVAKLRCTVRLVIPGEPCPKVGLPIAMSRAPVIPASASKPRAQIDYGTPVASLGLSVRTLKFLKEQRNAQGEVRAPEIATLGELARMKERDLLRRPGLARRCLKECKEILAGDYGIALGE